MEVTDLQITEVILWNAMQCKAMIQKHLEPN